MTNKQDLKGKEKILIRDNRRDVKIKCGSTNLEILYDDYISNLKSSAHTNKSEDRPLMEK